MSIYGKDMTTVQKQKFLTNAIQIKLRKLVKEKQQKSLDDLEMSNQKTISNLEIDILSFSRKETQIKSLLKKAEEDLKSNRRDSLLQIQDLNKKQKRATK